MPKVACTLTVLLALTFNAHTGGWYVAGKPAARVNYNQQVTVTICTSKNAYAYHTAGCGALKRCKAGTETLTREQAVQKGYTACKVCKP